MASYIPKKNAHHLNEFQYSGGTSSITYQHIWSPFAGYLLKFVPKWVAPNAITLSAILILIVAHILFMLPDEKGIPGWKSIMVGISIFMYQNLDNMDGKQARRTNSSSPLGMLFDHGADAVVGYLVALQTMKLLGISFQLQLVMVPLFLMTQYFCAMWSQYCIGFFKLGRINPVDQGLPIYALLYIVASQMDLSLFKQQHWIGTYGQQGLYFLIIPLIPQLFVMSREIFLKSTLPKSEIIFMTLLFFVSAGSVLLTLHRIPILSSKIFYPFFYSIMFIWCRNMILIQIQFITKQKYKVFNLGTNAFLIMTLIYIIGRDYLPVSDHVYFMAMCFISGVIFFQFVIRAFQQAAKILGIRVFSLKKRNDKIN